MQKVDTVARLDNNNKERLGEPDDVFRKIKYKECRRSILSNKQYLTALEESKILFYKY